MFVGDSKQAPHPGPPVGRAEADVGGEGGCALSTPAQTQRRDGACVRGLGSIPLGTDIQNAS